MVKINEFHDMDIPQEIIPKPDYDVPSDLLIFMRNDPMFYRKNFFPAVEKYKENTKDTAPLENMVKRGLGEYCNKFKIENPKDELMGEGDIIDLVRTIIADEMEDLNEDAIDWLKKKAAQVGNYVRHGSGENEEQFAQYKAFAKRRLQLSDPSLLQSMREKFGKNVAPADLARAIAQARKEAA